MVLVSWVDRCPVVADAAGLARPSVVRYYCISRASICAHRAWGARARIGGGRGD